METILITGSEGMIGTALIEEAKLNNLDIYCVDYKNIDLRDFVYVDYLFNKVRPTFVIHLAAKVGGVKGNRDYMADFYTENIMMNNNILYHSHLYNVKKVVSLLSTCVYPDCVKYPLTEDQIHNGPPHSSNYGYAYAKRMLDIQSQAYRDQFGCNFVTIIPNNLFGNFDNFDLENSHVIPAIIRKIYEAKLNNTDVILWGAGESLREFTYSKDLAKILLYVLNSYNDRIPMNVGNPIEYSIKQIVEKIVNILQFEGKIVWDTTKPSGQFKKPSSNKKFLEFLKNNNINFQYTDFDDNLKMTCLWFVENYPNVRGV
jgi:GDP-L-fucose synthase